MMLKKELKPRSLQYLMYLGTGCAWGLLSMMSSSSYAAPSAYDLKVELSPAVCLLDPSQQKQRKCLEGYSFVILGLFPDTTHNCVTATSAQLPPLQAQAISRVMPNEYVRQQVWTQVGGCESGNASQYFRKIVNFSQKLKIPNEVRSSKTYQASYHHIENRLIQVNQQLPKEAIRLICQTQRKQTFLTQIHVCYKSNGQYKACTASVPAQQICPSSFMIQGTY